MNLPRSPITVLLTLALTGSPAVASEAAFSFMAIGDTAYNGERDYPVYSALIEVMNERQPAFTVHVGDLWGAGSCGDAEIDRAADFFASYEHPVIYTPGDNEWTDCGAEGLGAFDALERLQTLRSRFFAEAQSLGATPMPLVRQSDVSEYKALVENARWEQANVLFMTAHVPGSQNGADHRSMERMQEFMERNAANVAWINDGFRIAIEEQRAAVVLTIHAELFDSNSYYTGPFGAVLQAIREGGERFGGPVLLIHGDFHRFTIDRPFLEVRGEEHPPRYPNITRLQVHGAPEIAAVRVGVNPETPGVFSFEPILVPMEAHP